MATGDRETGGSFSEGEGVTGPFVKGDDETGEFETGGSISVGKGVTGASVTGQDVTGVLETEETVGERVSGALITGRGVKGAGVGVRTGEVVTVTRWSSSWPIATGKAVTGARVTRDTVKGARVSGGCVVPLEFLDDLEAFALLDFFSDFWAEAELKKMAVTASRIVRNCFMMLVDLCLLKT